MSLRALNPIGTSQHPLNETAGVRPKMSLPVYNPQPYMNIPGPPTESAGVPPKISLRVNPIGTSPGPNEATAEEPLEVPY